MIMEKVRRLIKRAAVAVACWLLAMLVGSVLAVLVTLIYRPSYASEITVVSVFVGGYLATYVALIEVWAS